MNKKCKKCEKEKDISEFYSHPATADRHLNFCKECYLETVHKYRCKNINQVRGYDRKRNKERLKDKKHIASKLKCKKEYYKRTGLPSNVSRKLKGFKPEKCEICRRSSTEIVGTLHAHHPDYSRPFDVVWVCPVCHCFLHNKTKNKHLIIV